MPGLTPKSITEMFGILKTMDNCEIKLRCHMVEIYLSQLKDLLRPPGSKQVELEVKKQSSRVQIKGVTEVEIKSAQGALDIFENGLA